MPVNFILSLNLSYACSLTISLGCYFKSKTVFYYSILLSMKSFILQSYSSFVELGINSSSFIQCFKDRRKCLCIDIQFDNNLFVFFVIFYDEREKNDGNCIIPFCMYLQHPCYNSSQLLFDQWTWLFKACGWMREVSLILQAAARLLIKNKRRKKLFPFSIENLLLT